MGHKRRPASTSPSRTHTDKLLAFLPIFDAEGFDPVLEWHGGPQEDGSVHVSFPTYHPAVDDFIRVASEPPWAHYTYGEYPNLRWLEDPTFLHSATFDQLRSLLTFIIRGERFNDGHVGDYIENGSVARILRRLKALWSRSRTTSGVRNRS